MTSFDGTHIVMTIGAKLTRGAHMDAASGRDPDSKATRNLRANLEAIAAGLDGQVVTPDDRIRTQGEDPDVPPEGEDG